MRRAGLMLKQQALVFAHEQLVKRNEALGGLQRSKDLLTEAEKISHTGSWEFDRAREKWIFSEEWLRIHGCEGNSPSNEDVQKLCHPEDRAKMERAFHLLQTQGQSFATVSRIIRLDNSEVRWVKATGKVSSLRSQIIVGTTQDITVQKRSEDILRRDTQLLEASQSTARVGGWELDIATDSLFWTAETYRIYDTTPVECSPSMARVFELYLPESRRLAKQALSNAIEHGEGCDLELETLTAKGRRIDLRTTCEVTLRDGKPVKLIGIFQDITERKASEKRRRKNERLYQQLFNHAPVGYHEIDVRGHLVTVNQTELKLLGYSEKEMLGRPVAEFMVDQQGSAAAIREKITSKASIEGAYERKIKCKDGTILDVLMNDILIRNDRDKITGIRTSLQDNSVRKATERALIKSEKQYASLIHSVEGVVWEADAKSFQFTFVSSQAERLLGYPTSRWTEDPTFWADHLHPEDREWAVNYCASFVRTHEDHQFEYRMMAADGRTVWMRDIVSLVMEKNEVVKLRGLMIDITKSKQSEVVLRESEERFRRAVLLSPFPIMLHAEDGAVIQTSDSWCEITGYDREELKTIQDWTERAYGERKLPVVEEIESLYGMTGSKAEGVYTICTKEGGTRIWDFHSASLGQLSDGRRLAISMAMDVTERKTAEEALRRNTQLLEVSQSIAKLGGWELDIPTGHLFWTAETYRIHETSPDEFDPTVDAGVSFFLPESRRLISEALEAAMERGEGYDLELETLTTKGRRIDVRTTCVVTKAKGRPVKLTGIFQDITDRKQAEIELKKTQGIWEFARDGSGDGLWDLDMQKDKLNFNKLGKEMLGYAEDDIGDEVKEWDLLIHPEDMLRVRSTVMKHIEGKTPHYSCEYRMRCKDDSYKWILSRGLVVDRDAAAKPIRMLGTTSDITERKQAERILREKERLLSSTARIGQIGGWTLDLESGTLEWTEETFRIHELSSADKPDLTHAIEFYHQDDQPMVMAAVEAMSEKSESSEFDARIITARGNTRWVRATGQRIRKEDGRNVIEGTVQDITSRKESELQLRKLSNIIEQAPLSIVITNLDGDIEYANPRFTQVTGYTLEEAIGQNPRILQSGETADEVYDNMWETLTRGEVWSGELINKRKNGEIYLETAVIAPIFDDQGKITHYTALKDDITAQKRREEDAAAKLVNEQAISEMKTRFISVTSHQFRTSMAAAMASAELLANHLDELSAEKRKNLFDRINSSLNRMTVMLDEVLLINRIDAKRVEVRPSKINLSLFVNDLIAGVKAGDSADHRFELQDDSGMKTFMTDENIMHHILENLMSNAVHYSPAETIIKVHLTAVNDELQVSVEDQGIGIPREDRERIFEPFERGSNVGSIKGTGLGLNIVKRMTEMLSGSITLECPEGGGSCFTLTLPQSLES